MGKLQATGRQVISRNATFMQVAFMSMGVTVLQNSILDLKRQLEEAAEDQATLLAVQVRAECHMSPSLQHNTTLLSA